MSLLSAIASAIAARPVRVIEDPRCETAYYDRSTSEIHVAVCPYAAQRGFLAHELGHERFTDAGAWKQTVDLAPYHNLVEDIRINLGLSDQLFANARAWIQDTWRHLTSEQPNGVWAAESPSATVSCHAHGAPTADQPWDAEADGWLKANLPTILVAPDIAALRPVLESLKALDEKWQKKRNGQDTPPTKPEPKPGKGEGKGDGKGEGKGDGQSGTAKDRAQKAAKALNGPGSPMHTLHDPIVSNDPPGDQPGNGSSSKTGFADAHDCIGQAPPGYPISDQIIDHLRAWRNRMAEALMATDDRGVERNHKRGRLDGSRLASMCAGTTDRCFSRPRAERRAVNTAIDILLDTSGSTTNYCIAQHLAASAYALAEACSRVPGVQLGLLRYDSMTHRLLPISHNRHARLEHATALSQMCTETECAVLRSVSELRAVPVERRICINCTDGARCRPDTRELAKQLGVEYYELHIIDETRADYDDAICVKAADIHQGLDRLVRSLRIVGR